MTRQANLWQRLSKRPVTRCLAAGAAAGMVAALVIPSLPAAAASRAGWPGRVAAAASGGTLRGWGLNDNGQLGDGTSMDRNIPIKVKLPPGTRITSARAGCEHTLGLTSKGRVLAWGLNDHGQLGDGSTASSDAPVRVRLPAGTRITSVRAGCFFSLALTSRGRVLAWGDNDAGQLGDGRIPDSARPVRVRLPAGTKAAAISAGFEHGLALTSRGRVLAWGLNNFGQLGDGTIVSNGIPGRVKLPAGTTVTAIAAGDSHSLARTSRGRVLAWGLNSDGELGDGTATDRRTPVRSSLPNGARVRGLFACCDHTLALTTAGTVLAWGLNSFGQIGDGTTTERDTPVKITMPPGTKVKAISAGCDHSLARTASGHVLEWGSNNNGQLGDGTTTERDTPVRVQLPAGLAAIAIGSGPDANVSLAITRKAAR